MGKRRFTKEQRAEQSRRSSLMWAKKREAKAKQAGLDDVFSEKIEQDNGAVEPVTFDVSKSLTIQQTLDDVEMSLFAKSGRLETYTLRFQGGSHISFTVEE